MSLIHCTDPCVYQRDGLCELVRAGSWGRPGYGCVNFVPLASKPYSKAARASRMLATRMSSSPSGTTSFPWVRLGSDTW